MLMGFGSVDITPDIGTELGGYGYYLNRRVEDVLDALQARAVVIEDKGARYALIDADIVQLSESVVRAVRVELEKSGYAEDAVIAVATHTHTAPLVGRLEGCGVEDAGYVKRLPGKLIAAVKRAEEDMRGVTGAEISEASAPGIAYNRASAGGPVDEMVRGALYRRENARPIALVHYACHPVTLGPIARASADYPGKVVRALAARGIDALFLNGMCGDIDPVSNRGKWGSGTGATITAMGEGIAEGFMRGLAPSSLGAVRAISLEGWLSNAPLDDARIDERLAEVASSAGDGAPEARVARAWAAEMRARTRAGEDIEKEKYIVCALAVGPVVVAAFPYECYTRVALTIRASLKGYMALILGCGDHTRGYLPTEEEFGRAGYAALASAFLYLRPPVRPGEAERMATDIGERLARWLEEK